MNINTWLLWLAEAGIFTIVFILLCVGMYYLSAASPLGSQVANIFFGVYYTVLAASLHIAFFQSRVPGRRWYPLRCG